VSLGYKDVADPSVFVKFPVLDRDESLLVWTTTPWTLVSNAAVAVHPELVYVRARLDGETYVLAEALVERVLGEGAEIVERFPGTALEGVRYEPPFPFIPAQEYGERGHSVLLADFVTATDGTGLVHTAIAFGEDDFQLGRAYGLNVINPVRLDGTYDERIGPYAGRFVKDADPDLVEDLRGRGRLLRSEVYEHSYPHCWRCGTPLLYYAKPSWYIATSRLRDELLASNEAVDWHPEHIKHGRFGDWLSNNVDWALSRERYWGTPLPVWRCENGHLHCIGSFGELAALSGESLDDHHRPFVDDVAFPCGECGEPMRRVPEVIDVWFDSGCMPFAQHHAPFENEEVFDSHFPADFICEALDQTRGWFYSLLGVSTLLFDRAPYRAVLCLGLLVDEEGQKMSKSKGNVVAPWEVIERFGADALRWYFFTSKQPWDGYRFGLEAVGESSRKFMGTLWAVHHFLSLYRVEKQTEPTDFDRWILSRLAAVVEEVTERLDRFDATFAGRAIADFVEDLSNWYLRRNRRRLWAGESAAFDTLRECLATVARLLAPFTPFLADELYEQLEGEEVSVHVCDWPGVGGVVVRDEALEADMAVAREAVRLGQSARAAATIKLRQPLRAAVVVAAGRERAALERLADVVADELNVKELRFVEQADELGSYEVKPNYRTLGPRFGKDMPRVAGAVAALDPARVAAAVRDGGTVGIVLDGNEHPIAADDLILAMQPLEGYQLEREGAHAVALELALDDELRREGLAREVVRAVQETRKRTGLEVSDRIVLTLGGDEALLEAARAYEPYVAGEVLAERVSYDGAAVGEAAEVEGRELRVLVERV
jgi:isoleucyl-tRNA synthetase